jgi:hypothetical protein
MTKPTSHPCENRSAACGISANQSWPFPQLRLLHLYAGSNRGRPGTRSQLRLKKRPIRLWLFLRCLSISAVSKLAQSRRGTPFPTPAISQDEDSHRMPPVPKREKKMHSISPWGDLHPLSKKEYQVFRCGRQYRLCSSGTVTPKDGRQRIKEERGASRPELR